MLLITFELSGEMSVALQIDTNTNRNEVKSGAICQRLEPGSN